MTRYLIILYTFLFFSSGLALAQDTQTGDSATASDEVVTDQDAVEVAPVRGTDASSAECDGRVPEIVARVEAASTSDQRSIVEACFERFNRSAESLRDSRDTGLTYSEASTELELQLRLLQTMSRQLEPGGRLERNIAALSAEISDLETQISLQRERFPDRAAALEARVKELDADYQARVAEYVALRVGVADRMTELTTFRPIIALEIRADRFEEVLEELGLALQAAKTAMLGIIDQNERERETE